MSAILDSLDYALLDGWQRRFPLVSRPFAEIAEKLELSEAEVLERLRRLSEVGAVSRIGATCRPNTAGASTLAAVAAPDTIIESVAAEIGAEPGVNHSYQREHEWNIWFVVTGPDRAYVDAALNRIRTRTRLKVLDLPLVRPFNICLGFALDGVGRMPGTPQSVDTSVLQPGDRKIMQALSNGLQIVPTPFATLAKRLGRTEEEMLQRIAALAAAGMLTRIGVIVRHRALGWRSNAMVVWDVPPRKAAGIGPVLATVPGVTLCYQRRSVPGIWPYTLYCMIHARSRGEALGVLDRVVAQAGLGDVPHQVLFSLRCFKQTGAMLAAPSGAAA